MTVHKVHQALDDGEPQARALVLPREGAVGLGEPLEHTGDLVLRDADACIADAKVNALPSGRRGRLRLSPDLQMYASLLCEFQGIAHEVEKDLAQAGFIAQHRLYGGFVHV